MALTDGGLAVPPVRVSVDESDSEHPWIIHGWRASCTPLSGYQSDSGHPGIIHGWIWNTTSDKKAVSSLFKYFNHDLLDNEMIF